MPVELKRLRSAADLAQAAADLIELGYEQCQSCMAWFKPADLVPDKDCRTEVCVKCRHQQDIDATTPRFDD